MRIIMNLKKLIEIRNEAEAKKNKIDNLLQKYKELQQLIMDVNLLKQNAGEMIFTGRNNSESNLLQQIKINDVAGCVAIPELILQLAEKRMKEYEIELNVLQLKYQDRSC